MHFPRISRALFPLPLLLAIACGGSAPEPATPAAPDPTPAPAPAPAPPPAPIPDPPKPDPAPAAEPTAQAKPEPVAPATPPPPPEPQWVEGKIKSHKGKDLAVQLPGSAPAVGAKGQLDRYFEGKPGEKSPLGALGGLLGGTIQGWIGVADVTVKKVDKDVVTFTIDEEKSKMKINGKPVDHFGAGAKVRFAPAS